MEWLLYIAVYPTIHIKKKKKAQNILSKVCSCKYMIQVFLKSYFCSWKYVLCAWLCVFNQIL